MEEMMDDVFEALDDPADDMEEEVENEVEKVLFELTAGELTFRFRLHWALSDSVSGAKTS